MYGECVSLCLWVCSCMFACLWLICRLCVCDASDRGHNPEPQTVTSSRGSARGREAPAGGRGWEKYPSKLEWWYSHAKPLNTLSPHFSLCLNYQPCRWEDMRRASLTPKANKCGFPHCLSDGWSLSVLWKSLIFGVTFHWAIERLAARDAFEKAHRSPLYPAYFYHKGPGCAGL